MNSENPPETEREKLLAEIDRFLRDTGMGHASFGLVAVNSTNFVTSVRHGRNPGEKIRNQVRAFIEDRLDVERSENRKAIAAINALGGFICMKPDDGFDSIPDGVEPRRLRRMIAIGLLVPSGDAMFGVTSQTYKPSALPI